MSCLTEVLGSVKFLREDANTAAVCVPVPDEKLGQRMLAQMVSRFMVTKPPREAVIVQLTPRNFSETAVHFQRVTTPFAWPTDEHDVD